MKLYIVRHAIAFPHGTPGMAEDQRPLTDEGIKKMEKAAAGLKALEVAPDVILSSPLPRAWQTAEIVQSALGEKTKLRSFPALAPTGQRKEVYEGLLSFEKLKSLMLVGHQPSLGEIAGEIAWGSAAHALELKKGGACAIEIERLASTPRGTLLWLVTPSILRSLVS